MIDHDNLEDFRDAERYLPMRGEGGWPPRPGGWPPFWGGRPRPPPSKKSRGGKGPPAARSAFQWDAPARARPRAKREAPLDRWTAGPPLVAVLPRDAPHRDPFPRPGRALLRRAPGGRRDHGRAGRERAGRGGGGPRGRGRPQPGRAGGPAAGCAPPG